MSALRGLPDFGAPVGAPDVILFRAFEGGPQVLVPDGLEVATQPDGRPQFKLSIVRRPPHDPRPGYAGLDIGLGRRMRPDVALAAARAAERNATITPALIETGWVRLIPGGSSVTLPDDLTQPTPLGLGGLASAHWAAALTLASGELLKGALTASQVLLVSARAEVQVLGIAPRVPSKVTFNPGALCKAILAPGGDSRQLGYDSLVLFFARTPSANGLTVTPPLGADQLEPFAQAMAGRVLAAFGKSVPAPLAEGAPFVELTVPPDGSFTWDLSQPMAVVRPWLFTLDPFDAARKLIAQAGPAGVIAEISTPVLQLGFQEIAVHAALPQSRQGFLQMAVAIDVPPHPPQRPQGVSGTVQLTEPDDGGVFSVRLSPLEKLAYDFHCYAVVAENDGIKRLDAAPRAGTTNLFTVHMEDFPVAFVVLDADASILSLATIDGTLQYQDGAAAVVQPFSLSTAQPRAALPLVPGATAASITADVKPLAGSAAPIHLDGLDAASRHFSLASFPEYGPQTIDVACRFSDPKASATVNLLAEGQPETAKNIITVFLTPAQPSAQFSYLASSPFQPGYRWRAHEGGTWSPVLHPGAPLQLDGDQISTKAGPMIDDLGGIHFYTGGDDPTWVYYVPGDPTPELDTSGIPTLSLIVSGAGAYLALGVRWEATEGQLAAVQGDLQQRHPELTSVQFGPAPVTVSEVVLEIGDGAGRWTPLKSSTSSGFPPYNTIFNVALDDAQKGLAVAALDGRAGCLRVELRIALPPEVAATFAGAPATLSRSTDVSTWFPTGKGKDHLRLTGATIST